MAKSRIRKPTVKVKTIWANPNTYAAFAEQDVNFSEPVYPYEELIAVFKEYTTYDHYFEMPLRVGDTDLEAIGIPGSTGSSSGVPTIVKRRFGVTTAGATFQGAFYSSGGAYARSDSNCIPVEIRKVYIE